MTVLTRDWRPRCNMCRKPWSPKPNVDPQRIPCDACRRTIFRWTDETMEPQVSQEAWDISMMTLWAAFGQPWKHIATMVRRRWCAAENQRRGLPPPAEISPDL